MKTNMLLSLAHSLIVVQDHAYVIVYGKGRQHHKLQYSAHALGVVTLILMQDKNVVDTLNQC